MKATLLKNGIMTVLALSSGMLVAQTEKVSVDKSVAGKVEKIMTKPAALNNAVQVVPTLNSGNLKAVQAAPKPGYTIPENANFLSLYVPVNKSHPIGLENGQYAIFPLNQELEYTDASEGSPTTFSWVIPGGDPATSEDQDAIVTYKTKGVYAFPTLTTTNADGSSSYTVDDTLSLNPVKMDKKFLKAGGLADIWGTDAVNNNEWGYAYYGDTKESYLFGSNNGDDLIKSCGSMFFVPQEVDLTAVSAYVMRNPVSSDPNLKMKVEIIPLVFDEEDKWSFGEPVATKEFKFSEIIPSAGSSIGYNMGLAYVQLDQPIKIAYNFFVKFSGWPNSNLTDKFSFLLDQYGASASFIDAKSTSGEYHSYFRPNDLFGDADESGLNLTFMMGATVNYGDGSGQGVITPSSNLQNNAFAIADGIVIDNKSAKNVAIYNLMGQAVYAAELNGEGQTTATVAGNGAFVVKFVSANGNVQTVKVIK